MWPKSMPGPECPIRSYTTDGTLDAYNRLWDAASKGFGTDAAYYRVQGLNPDGTRNPAYERLVDVDNVIDYMICTFYVGDIDAPISNFLQNSRPNNFYAVYNRTDPDGFKFFRHDCEHTLFNVNENRTGPYPAGQQKQYFNPQWLHQQLAANAEYKMRFADHVYKHFFNDGVMTPQAAAQPPVSPQGHHRSGDHRGIRPLGRRQGLQAANQGRRLAPPGPLPAQRLLPQADGHRSQPAQGQGLVSRSSRRRPSISMAAQSRNGFALTMTAPFG